ncbi:MAG: hypothetical protein N2423_09015, partial [Novosphingobium sp.]|nr:hypothetical protein [Novosphingobium sp.]
MRMFADAIRRGWLAMAGGRSPWGNGSRGGDTEPGSADPGSEEGGKDGPDADRPRGPRNPWLPSGDTPPRRSARIDDIFRSQ